MYIVVAVVGLSVAILLQRVILHRYRADDVAFAGTFQLMVAAVMLPWMLINGASFDGFAAQWFPIALCTVGFGAGSVLYANTLKHIDASAFSVLFATQAIWIMLAGVWLYDERLGWLQLLGTLLVLLSVGMLANSKRVFRSKHGVLLGLLTGFIFGVAIAGSAYVSRSVEPITWTWLSFFLGGSASLLMKPSKIPLCKKLIRGKIIRPMLLLAIVYAVGNAAMNYAYITGPFSLVAPVRQAGIVVTALLAFTFLRDERTNISRKLIAAAVCTLGVIVLVIQN
jgi:drug/metabolite transporter (DMT)-like permease